MVLQVLPTDSRSRRRAVRAASALAVYAGMWLGWQFGWSWVTTPDAWALDTAHRIGAEHRGWVVAWNALCTVFSPSTFRVLALGLIVYALVRRPETSPGRCAPARRYRIALFLFVSVELSAVLTEVAKRLADRPRPVTAMVPALGTSFPSGHALGSMVAVLALAAVLSPLIRRSRWPWAVVAGALVVLLVGAGRVALNVHNPSDVLAGWALGYLYFVICLPVLRWRDPVTATDGTPEAPGTAR
jgi:membrane-associated phospholipid phosphatase